MNRRDVLQVLGAGIGLKAFDSFGRLFGFLGVTTKGVAFAQQGPGILDPGVASVVHAVTYIEVAPGAGRQRPAGDALKGYRDAVRKEPGNQRTDLLQQTGRPTHFVLLESWENKSAFDAHTSRSSAKELFQSPTSKAGGQVFGLTLAAPVDQRAFNSFSIATSASTDDALFVVTHVDTIPAQGPGAPDPGALLKQLADASRKEAGNLRFDVWQSDRKNHFTIVEAWSNQRALDAHTSASHTLQYRMQLQPLAGSPLDERVFSALK